VQVSKEAEIEAPAMDAGDPLSAELASKMRKSRLALLICTPISSN
jgi:hypothetical protein